MKNIWTIGKRELGAFFNSPVAYIVIFIYLLVSGYLFFSQVFLVGEASLRDFFGTAPLLFIFFFPAITMRLLAEEKRTKTIELLITLPVTDWQVILGKFVGAFGVLVVALALTLAYPMTLSAMGDLDWGTVAAGYMGLLFLGATYIAIGLMASSWSKHQVVASLATIAITFALYLAGKMLPLLSPALAPVVEYISLDSHFVNISRGVLDTRDLVYYLSLIGLCLFFAVISLSSRAWSTSTQRASALVFMLFVSGIVVDVNLLAAQRAARLDLTADHVYTISEASKRLARSLDDRLTIKAFIGRELPPRVKTLARYIADTVVDYANYSEGRIEAEVIYIGEGDKEAKQEAARYKVQPLKIGQYSSSKTSVQLSYLGVAFQYGGKIEVLPPNVVVSDLEYQISSTIKRMTRKKRIKIGFSSGHGEPSFHRGLATIKHFSKDFEAIAVDLSEGKTPIPDDIAVLMVVGPKKRFAPRAKYEVDKFLMRGGALGVFIDGMVLETPRGDLKGHQLQVARANATGLEDMLEYYGVKVRPTIVMDKRNRPLPLVRSNGRTLLVNYPGFPVVTALDKKNPVTQFLKFVLFAFPSALELVGPAKTEGDGLKSTVLASSSAESWLQQGFFLYNPLHRPQEGKERGPFPLAVTLNGSFRSFFSGRKVPEPGPALGLSEKAANPDGSKKSSASARLLVVGDSDFVQDQFIRFSPGNLPFFLNSMEYLAQDTSLIAIRGKQQTGRRLEKTEDGDISLAKWGNALGVPVLFVLLGLFRWRLRSAARQRSAEELVAARLTAASMRRQAAHANEGLDESAEARAGASPAPDDDGGDEPAPSGQSTKKEGE